MTTARTTTARTRLLALLAAGLLVFAACGSDDNDGDSAKDDTEQTDSASTDETTDPNDGSGDADVDEPDADDQAIAEAAGLEAGDVPGDFSATPPDPSSQDSVFDNPTEGCEYLAEVREVGTVTAKAKSDEFDSPDGAQRVSSTIRVWTDADGASEAMALIGDEQTPDCLRDGLMASMASEPSAPALDDLTAEIEPGLLGDESLTVWVSGTISADGQSAPISFALSFVRVGRGVALVQHMWLGVEPDPELLAGYTAIVADRMSAFAE